eukprot:scaffold113445_cov47-Attheya_sp.AAC.1
MPASLLIDGILLIDDLLKAGGIKNFLCLQYRLQQATTLAREAIIGCTLREGDSKEARSAE